MITMFVFHNKVAEAKAKAKAKNVKAVPKAKAIENNPLVSFRYVKNDSWCVPIRTVRLISANAKYLWGLEMKRNDEGKMKYLPKRFLRSNVREFTFLKFNTPSMP